MHIETNAAAFGQVGGVAYNKMPVQGLRRHARYRCCGPSRAGDGCTDQRTTSVNPIQGASDHVECAFRLLLLQPVLTVAIPLRRHL